MSSIRQLPSEIWGNLIAYLSDKDQASLLLVKVPCYELDVVIYNNSDLTLQQFCALNCGRPSMIMKLLYLMRRCRSFKLVLTHSLSAAETALGHTICNAHGYFYQYNTPHVSVFNIRSNNKVYLLNWNADVTNLVNHMHLKHVQIDDILFNSQPDFSLGNMAELSLTKCTFKVIAPFVISLPQQTRRLNIEACAYERVRCIGKNLREIRSSCDLFFYDEQDTPLLRVIRFQGHILGGPSNVTLKLDRLDIFEFTDIRVDIEVNRMRCYNSICVAPTGAVIRSIVITIERSIAVYKSSLISMGTHSFRIIYNDGARLYLDNAICTLPMFRMTGTFIKQNDRMVPHGACLLYI